LISASRLFQRRARSRRAGFDTGHQQPIGVCGQRQEVAGFGAQSQAAVDQGLLGQHDQLVADRRRGADHDTPQRVERLGAGLDRTAAGDPQCPDHLDRSGLGLRDRRRGLAEDGAGDLLGIEAVGFAVHAAGQPVEAVDLVMTFLSLHLMVKHRQAEVADSQWLEAYERVSSTGWSSEMADAWSILGGLSQQHQSEHWPPWRLVETHRVLDLELGPVGIWDGSDRRSATGHRRARVVGYS
jgi:hypothetical protein